MALEPVNIGNVTPKLLVERYLWEMTEINARKGPGAVSVKARNEWMDGIGEMDLADLCLARKLLCQEAEKYWNGRIDKSNNRDILDFGFAGRSIYGAIEEKSNGSL